jgi:hydroxymethylpyrimidine pyrophosphatase-like HAD family hydrolase
MLRESVTVVPAQSEPFEGGPLVDEQDFYASYDWSLNAYPSVRDLMRYLDAELAKHGTADIDWQRDEIARNVFLLSCALLDTADDYLLGRRYTFSKVLGVFPALAPLTKLAQTGLHAADARHRAARQRVWNWRAQWEANVVAVLRRVLLAESSGPQAEAATARMRQQLAANLPASFFARHPRIPAAFRSQDLTHFDVLSLGEKFVAAFPDRTRPVLVTGLRTAGSYFATLLRAYLESQGYVHVQSTTLRPKAGLSRWEKERIADSAARNCLAAIIDEPVGTGGTIGKGIAILRKHGIPAKNTVVLFPVHRNGRNWKSSSDAEPLRACHVLTLEHHEWYKHCFVGSAAPEALIREYFEANGWSAEVDKNGAEAANAYLKAVSEDKYHTRVKQVYSVRLTRPGKIVKRYVLAKSVGWGWLGYHAFVAGRRLAEYVPPILGLRDGILYTDWITSQPHEVSRTADAVQIISSYVGSRARDLRLGNGSEMDVVRESQPARGFEELAGSLSGAYGKAGGFLKRTRIKRDLAALQAHEPVLIDGRMRPLEWIWQDGSLLKTDFEHHGMGKHQLNLTDAAYDLAETVLHWNLSQEQERELLKKYAARSGDSNVHQRMLLYKLLAGSWSIDRAVEHLNDPKMRPRHDEFNRQYLDSFDFLVLHTMRFTASLCRKPSQLRWSSPLAVLDIDGVIDKQFFGFPSTTFAGIQAISLLHRSGFAIALDTARSIDEVKEYCRAYGCVGGVAECGAYAWDAISGRERVLVSDESLENLERLRGAFRRTPGVFLNDDYRYSIKAHTYEKGKSVALPKILVQDLIAELGLEGLTVHHTYMDTTILANDSDKGYGLLNLLALAGMENAETYAVGDSGPDLPMFRTASHSFAPGHISCRAAAELLKCRVASSAYQLGFLECVRAIVGPSRSAITEDLVNAPQTPQEKYLVNLLKVADRSQMRSLVDAAADPTWLGSFVAE